MSGYCSDPVFAATQPGCMNISQSPWFSATSPPVHHFLPQQPPKSSNPCAPLCILPALVPSFRLVTPHRAIPSEWPVVLTRLVVTSASSPGTDFTLNNIFTCLYGWTAILGAFLLATLCVIKEVSTGLVHSPSTLCQHQSVVKKISN